MARGSTFNGKPSPRFCGGGCCRDLNTLTEDMLSFDYPALCIDCAEAWEAREAEDEAREDARADRDGGA